MQVFQVCTVTWTVCAAAQSDDVVVDGGAATPQLTATQCWAGRQSSDQQSGVTQFSWVNVKCVSQWWTNEARSHVTQRTCQFTFHHYIHKQYMHAAHTHTDEKALYNQTVAPPGECP